METIKKKEDQIVFSAEIDESLTNAVRRYINEILVLAIDEIEISKNGSPLYDETIAHRVGLIPLKMEKVFSEKVGAKLKLSSNKEGMVYSGGLKGNAKVVYENIPITSLNADEELEFAATAKFGKGNEHSKFSPGLMFYRNVVDVKVENDCPVEVVNTCPQGILKVKNGKIIVENASKCDLCEACVDFCKKQGKDSIKLVPTNKLVITLESFGQLDVKEILPKAVEALKKDLADISKKVK